MEIIKRRSWLILLLSISIYSQNTIKIDTLKFESNKLKTNGLELINQMMIKEDLCTEEGKLEKDYLMKKNKGLFNECLLSNLKSIRLKNSNLYFESNNIRYSYYCNSSELFYETTLIEISFSDVKTASKWQKMIEKTKLKRIKHQQEFVWENYNWLIICKDHILYWLIIPTEDVEDKIRNIFERVINENLINK